jgi:hypothetical protein
VSGELRALFGQSIEQLFVISASVLFILLLVSLKISIRNKKETY